LSAVVTETALAIEVPTVGSVLAVMVFSVHAR
jgi:hypothetical protein